MKKRSRPKSRPRRRVDPTVDTLEAIVESEGLKPKRSLINKLVLFWAKSTGEAQARGTRVAVQMKREEENIRR